MKLAKKTYASPCLRVSHGCFAMSYRGLPWFKNLCASASLRETTSILLTILCLFSATAHAADPIDALVKRSPFIPAGYVSGGSAKPANRAGVRLEFGGYTEASSRIEVSISNPATGESVWVPLRDKNAPYFVESFDAVGMSIAVKIDGSVVRLPLRAVMTDMPSESPAAATANPIQPLIFDPSSKSENKAAEDKQLAAPSSNEPNRIPRQGLRIPKRVDDPM